MILLLILVTFSATLVGSISGIGGGVVIKPVMDAIADYPIASINFLSSTTVLAMTCVSLLRSRCDSVKVNAVVGTPLAIGGAVGGVLGKVVLGTISHGQNVGLVQNILMVILTGLVFVYVMNKSRIRTLSITNRALATVLGLLLGLFSSFLGIGGGPINIMVLSICFSMDSKHAAINSIYIIFFSQTANVLTNLIQGTIPEFDPLLLIGMMTSGILGALLGRFLSRKLDNKHVDRLFMVLMAIIVLLSITNVVKFARL